MPSDSQPGELWQACLDFPDDTGVWERFLEAYLPVFRSIAVRVAFRWGAAGEASDVLQEICLKVSGLARQGKLSGLDNGRRESYLKALAANAASDYFRCRRRERRNDQTTLPLPDQESQLQSELGVDALEAGVLFRQLDDLIEGMPRERHIFHLYYRQGFSAQEIAAIPALGLSVKGVESLLRRITKRMKERLDERGKGFSAGTPS